MNTFDFSLLFLILVGMKFCSPGNDPMENEADKFVARNPFGCFLNLIGIVSATIVCVVSAIYYSVAEKWWIFLLFIPAYFLAGLVEVILCKIIPFRKITSSQYDPYIAQAIVKKEFGVFLVILSYILLLIF